MKRTWIRKRPLFLSTTVIVCALNQMTAAQTAVSNDAKAVPERLLKQQFPAPADDDATDTNGIKTSLNSNDEVDSYTHIKTYVNAGDYEQAIALAKKVVEQNPTSGAAYNDLGVLYCSVQQYDKAVSTLNSAHGYDSGNANITANFGTANYLLGNYPRALELLRDALKQDPTSEVAQNNLAQVLLKTGQYQEAIERLLMVTHAQEGKYDARLYNDIGVAHLYLKHFKAAAEYLKKAAELDETYAPARFNLGMVSLNINDRATAYDQYVALKSLDRPLAEKLYAKLYESRVLRMPRSAPDPVTDVRH